MPTPAGPYDFVYEHTDIPEGMTIHEWGAQRAAERLAIHKTAREDRRRRRARAGRRWLEAFRVPTHRPRLHGREAHG